MPLKSGKSKAAFTSNVKAETEAGKKPKQAVAIAYSKARQVANMPNEHRHIMKSRHYGSS